MNIVGDLLSGKDVVLGLSATDAEHACEEIAMIAAHLHKLDDALVFRALWRREQIGSTGIGHGVAIPHARIPGITTPILLFARTKLPVPFGALDHQPISTFFMILVPEHAIDEHLRILATVSDMLSDRAFRNRLETATEPTEIQRLFNQWTTKDVAKLVR
jgi:PTS system nitrogen regulatory IIA component